jgi:hypothetical protein
MKREVKRMKGKSILISVTALLMLALMVAPALAAPNPNAWHTVPASFVTNKSVTYAQLTDYCLNVWGLSENPYPNYPASVHPAYFVFTIQIGDDVFEGVSVNTQTLIIGNPAISTAHAIWYLGEWGKTNVRMNQGFEGTNVLQLYDFALGPPPSWSYVIGTFSLEGFQRFNHQSLSLSVDSRTGQPTSGICTVLGNRDKM